VIETRPIESITVGDRVRQDLGDIDSLAESITNNGGLLQPILIQSDGTLIAGERRLAACKAIGRDQIEVNIRNDFTSATAVLISERDENTCRKDFTPTEFVALGRKLEELERPAAEASRQATQGRPKKTDAESASVSRDRHKNSTRSKVSEALGISGSKYDEAKKVVAAAEAGDPVAIEAAKEMDRTGKVSPAYRKVKREKPAAPKPLDLSKERNRQRAEKQLERLWKLLAALDGARIGLETFDIAPALAVTSDEDAKEMDRMLAASSKAFRKLRSDIQTLKGL
jgi:ParB family chromosome partitioning protein